ncbi:MAG TPA: FG-GAP-like repeat-containing protein [Baekduia sp.]|uniref:FG-GAP-like repeat-containing protein n=1 Tax=Baekduia sp. TaxID=2600305 RepID=UPI002D796212|nr:FG-GAP-like repeat-containing protein [Baekduia sp.]HET6508201.1 FG-GAP-like repeat-containing protein [Baekduia sp.]
MFAARRLALLACACTCATAALAPAVAHAATGGAPAIGARAAFGLGAGVTDPRALAVADLDGDGRPDLVAGSANGGTGMVSVLRNTGNGGFATPLGSPFGLGATAGGVGALATGDLNGDGRDDVLAAIGSGTTDDDELVPLAGDGTGALNAGGSVAVPGQELAGVALADLDGDGDLDALSASTTAVAGEQLGIVEQTASGLTAVGSVGASGTMLARGLAVGDLTGDGAPDALVVSANAGAGSAWVATGAGLSLSPGTPVAVGADPVAVALADVDGDGDLDGLVLDGSSDVLTVLRNDGAGNLTASSVLVDGLASGTGLATGDLNGDGHVDAVITDGLTGLVGVLPGDGAGGFGTPTWAVAGAGPRSPVVADLDGDGQDDLATADATGDTVSVLRNVGAPAPAGALSAPFAAQAVGTTGPARTIAITNPTGSARLRVTGVRTAGDAPDDFLVTGDTCTGASVASGGDASCTVRLRFSPSAAGSREATLRLRLAGGDHFDVPLSATATATAGDDATDTTTTTDPDAATDPDPTTDPATPTATTTTAAATTTVTQPAVTTPVPAAPKPAVAATPATPRKTTRLILTLSHSKLTAKRGAKVAVGLALGRAAKVILRVKHGGRTVDLLRASATEGRNTIAWDGKLGRKAAPAGTYRLDVYAVAADGRAARRSVTLTIKR